MDIQSFNPFTSDAVLLRGRYLRTVCIALLLGAGAVHAAGTQEMAAEHPLNLSLPRDAKVLQEWRRTHEAEYINKKQPYGSGYEARGLGGAKHSGTDLLISPAGRAAGSGNSGSGSTGGGGSGGGGGAGGRSR